MLGGLALGAGCVSQGKYDAALSRATDLQAQLEQQRAVEERTRAAERHEATRLQAAADTIETRAADTLRQLAEQQKRADTCTQALDQAVAMAASFRTELVRQGRNVDELLAAKGSLAGSLAQAQQRLEELRRAQAAADARTTLFRELASRLKRMIDSGDLQVVLRSGRMLLALSNDVLFDSGKAEIKGRGKQALTEVAAVLSTLSERRFHVAGHSDDEPIQRSAFASNWELSTARGLAVVTFLLKSGMRPETLSAAGYAEFDPVEPNDSASHRAKNRRIEIVLQPNIAELISLPEAG